MTGVPVRVAHLTHRYAEDDAVPALDDVTFDIAAGSSAALVGPSGSGKSTLLTILAGLQRPTNGEVLVGDTDLTTLGEPGLLTVRARHLAVVVQNASRNLLPYASALDNLHFAQRGPRRLGREVPDPADLLARIGLARLAGARVDRLSGGERQRVALATGLAAAPGVLLADEPTSALDRANRDVIVELLEYASATLGITTIVVTHDHAVADRFGTTLALADGRLTASAP